MDYPGSKLNRNIRRIILIFFISLFLVLTPTIIMYAIGYRYDFSNGLLKETGAVSIDIEPTDAEVYLDTIQIKSGMPIRLKNITPRKYHIRISLDGYFDWNKDIEVINKQTVYIKEISLIKKQDPTLLLPGSISDLWLSKNSKYLVYRENDYLRLLDLSNHQTTTIYTDKNRDLTITWSENNNYFSINDQKNPLEKLILINADNPQKTFDLAANTKEKITKFQWKNSSEPELFYSTDKEIRSYKPNINNVVKITTNNYLDWLMEDGSLWTMQITTDTKNFKITKDTIGFAADFPINNANILPVDLKSLKLIAAKRDQVLLKHPNQSLMFLITPKTVYKISADKFTISPYENWWLFWTPWELTTYAENSDEPTLLNRSGEGLRQVMPLDKYNTLGLVWNKKTTALFPYYLVTDDLINQSVESLTVDSDSHTMYFSGKIKDESGVWKLGY